MHNPVQRTRKPLIGLVVALALANTLLLTEFLLYSRNSLAHHPRWLLGKLLTEVPVMGGELALQTRNLLAHNRLNLDAWHGFQEVLLNRVERIERVRLRYRLAERAYLVVIFAKTRDGFRGLRLSRHPDYPSMAFRADGEGRFLERRALDAPGPGWQWLDQAVEPIQTGVFGLRGSHAKVEVDDLQLWAGGRLIVEESFRNHQWGRALLASLTVVVLLSLLPLRRDWRGGLPWSFLGQLVLAGGLALAFAFDWFWWSPRYHQKNHNLFDAEPQRFERWRRDLTAVGDDLSIPAPDPEVLEVLGAPQARHLPYRLQIQQGSRRTQTPDQASTQDHPLVLVLGTSQTYGEGATWLEQAMVARLAQARPEQLFVNAGMRGSESFNLVDRYFSHLENFRPDLTVVNLGTNDRDPARLREALERLAARSTRLLFVLEANSPETSYAFHQRNLQVMREVAGRHSIPLLDLHAALRRVQDVGLLWWDFVHPTSLGHRLAGEWLAQELPR